MILRVIVKSLTEILSFEILTSPKDFIQYIYQHNFNTTTVKVNCIFYLYK